MKNYTVISINYKHLLTFIANDLRFSRIKISHRHTRRTVDNDVEHCSGCKLVIPVSVNIHIVRRISMSTEGKLCERWAIETPHRNTVHPMIHQRRRRACSALSSDHEGRTEHRHGSNARSHSIAPSTGLVNFSLSCLMHSNYLVWIFFTFFC